MQKELQKSNVPIFNTLIRRPTGYQQAAIKGVPIRALKSGDLKKAWQDYKHLGKEVRKILK